MINWKKLFKKEEPPKPKVWNLEEGHVIVPAFIDGLYVLLNGLPIMQLIIAYVNGLYHITYRSIRY